MSYQHSIDVALREVKKQRKALANARTKTERAAYLQAIHSAENIVTELRTQQSLSRLRRENYH